MTNTHNFAKRELDILVAQHKDPDNRPIIEPFIPEILALCEKFGNNGDSGSSAPYTAGAIACALEKLLLQKPICPILGIEEEWMEIGDHEEGKPIFQNTRCSALFKIGIDGRPYYLDAVIFVESIDGSPNYFTANNTVQLRNGKKLKSALQIKSFPFTPKSFYLDVERVGDICIPTNELYLKDIEEYYNLE